MRTNVAALSTEHVVYYLFIKIHYWLCKRPSVYSQYATESAARSQEIATQRFLFLSLSVISPVLTEFQLFYEDLFVAV